MGSQDTFLIVFLFGGHAFSAVLGLVLLYPFFGFLPRRYLLSLALLTTPAGFGYLTLFDLAFSGQFLAAALPAVLSATLIIAFIVLARRSGANVARQALIAAAMLMPIAWGNIITVLFAHSCFMGACA